MWAEDKGLVDMVYDQLAEALNRLPIDFPRTASNVEIRILKKIFSPEEATIAPLGFSRTD